MSVSAADVRQIATYSPISRGPRVERRGKAVGIEIRSLVRKH